MIVTVEPTSDKAAVVEKKAEMEVMVPALGMENAKFVSVPAALVRSITPPTMLTPGAELPEPTKPGVPTSPPAIVVSDNGIPEL